LSTADPFGLRRAALGIVQILVDKQIDVDLAQAVELVAAAQPIEVTAQAKAQVLEFIGGRLRSWLQDQEWAPDVIEAVLAAQVNNPYRAVIGIRELTEWVKRPDWEATLDGFARCVRITRNEPEHYAISPDLFQQPEENALYAAYQQASAQLQDGANVDGFLSAFTPMLPAVTAFFGTGKGDGVLVHAEDLAIRHNRLGLLQAISAMQQGRADLSHLSGF
jgi:glycyl-tRNA synthetase